MSIEILITEKYITVKNGNSKTRLARNLQTCESLLIQVSNAEQTVSVKVNGEKFEIDHSAGSYARLERALGLNS